MESLDNKRSNSMVEEFVFAYQQWLLLVSGSMITVVVFFYLLFIKSFLVVIYTDFGLDKADMKFNSWLLIFAVGLFQLIYAGYLINKFNKQKFLPSPHRYFVLSLLIGGVIAVKSLMGDFFSDVFYVDILRNAK